MDEPAPSSSSELIIPAVETPSTSTSIILERLSRSPSPTSSLTSSSSFDPHSDIPHQTRHVSSSSKTTSKTTLGLRELTRMAIDDRKRRKAASVSPVPSPGLVGPSIPLPRNIDRIRSPGGGAPGNRIRPIEIRDHGTQDQSHAQGQGDPPAYTFSAGDSPPVTAGGGEAFARDVAIKGWKIVGGSKWSDRARVGAYVVYEIEIISRSGGPIDILRRYTDFVNLRKALKAKYPHLHKAIPQLPGKAHMSKFDPKFIMDRQPRLQRFLRAVMLHPEMGRGGPASVIAEWVMGNDDASQARPTP